MFRRIRGKSNFAKVGTEYAYDQLCIYTQGNETKIQIQSTSRGTTAACLCHHPAVFFPNIHPIALVSFQGSETWTIRRINSQKKNEKGTNEIFKTGFRFNNTGQPNGHSKTD